MPPVSDSKRVIPSEVLGLAVTGLRIEAESLRELVNEDATVLAFLRHFG